MVFQVQGGMREDRPSRFPSHICSKTEIVRPSHAHWAQRAHVRAEEGPRKPGMQVIVAAASLYGLDTRLPTRPRMSKTSLDMPGLHEYARLRCGTRAARDLLQLSADAFLCRDGGGDVHR